MALRFGGCQKGQVANVERDHTPVGTQVWLTRARYGWPLSIKANEHEPADDCQREIDVEFPGRLTGTTAFDWFFRSPDGEDFDAALHRVSLWLKDAVTPAVAISHGLTGRLVRGAYLGLSRREMLQLSVPQDGIFRLAEGRVEFISSIT
jgi:broad specificity phosphatase PhoE